MKKLNLMILLCLLCHLTLKAQTPIILIESTIKIGAYMEDLEYFGFQKGDKLILDFQELKDKPIKELEISCWPNRSIFTDFKTIQISNKEIIIPETGVYKFRFSNLAVGGRICKIKIQRIPQDPSTQNFNSTVYWRTIYDTTFYKENERYIISRDTAIHNIVEQVAKVHSSTNLDGNKTTFNFYLPANTVVWSYYVGVDQSGQQAFENASSKLARSASPIVARIPGYGPLAAVALNSTSYIAQLQSGEDIDFYIVKGENVNAFLNGTQFYYIKKGKVINDFSRMDDINTSSAYHFCFSNDNAITGVQVFVKVTAVTVTEKWGIREVEKYSIAERSVPYLQAN